MEQLAKISQDGSMWVARSSDNLHYYTLRVMAENAGQTTITCTCAGHYYRDECRHSKMLSSRLNNATQDEGTNSSEPVSRGDA